jgi:hypothetical protein
MLAAFSLAIFADDSPLAFSFAPLLPADFSLRHCHFATPLDIIVISPLFR